MAPRTSPTIASLLALTLSLPVPGCAGSSRTAGTSVERRPPLAEHQQTAVAQVLVPEVLVPPPPLPKVELPPRPSTHFTLEDEQKRPIEVYPTSQTTERAPLVVALHATCMEPAAICDWFGAAGSDTGWLVCPSGNSTCYGEPDWLGTPATKAEYLEHAIDAAGAALPGMVDEKNGVLFGWSRGAFAARDILYAAATDEKFASLGKRFRGLVLMAGSITPDVKLIKAAGIQRVVMAAGDFDGSHETMFHAVTAMKAGGLEARYVSLGKIAHNWPRDFETRMREPIRWAAGLDEAEPTAKP